MSTTTHPQGAICFTNPDQIDFIRQVGVYGNVSIGDRPSTQSRQAIVAARRTRFGKLKDLLCVAPGYLVFLFETEESSLHGVWRVSSEPFFSTSKLFDPRDSYPYRFMMQPHVLFPNPVPSMELRKLLDRGMLWSIRSFERDAGAGFASVNPISAEEAQFLLSLFYRYNHRFDPTTTQPQYKHVPLTKHINFHALVLGDVFSSDDNLEVRATDFGTTARETPLEHALHCFIGYNLVRRAAPFIAVFGPYDQVVREVPVTAAGQHSVDFLLMYRSPVNGRPTVYSLMEVKTGKVSLNMLSQLLAYIKLFSERHRLDPNSVEGIYVGSSFDTEAIEYAKARAKIETERALRLMKYVVRDGAVEFSEVGD